MRNDNSLCTVDDKRTVLGHKRKIPHENLMFVDFFLIFIKQANFYLKRGCISSIPFLTLFYTILCFILYKLEVHKLQTQMTGKVLDGRNIIKGLPQALMQKPFIGILLDFNEVWHFKNFLTTRESHPEILPGSYRMHFAFFHRPFTPNIRDGPVSLLRIHNKKHPTGGIRYADIFIALVGYPFLVKN